MVELPPHVNLGGANSEDLWNIDMEAWVVENEEQQLLEMIWIGIWSFGSLASN